jgi:hypothetical protein
MTNKEPGGYMAISVIPEKKQLRSKSMAYLMMSLPYLKEKKLPRKLKKKIKKKLQRHKIFTNPKLGAPYKD